MARDLDQLADSLSALDVPMTPQLHADISALDDTRTMRLALEVMWDRITSDMEPEQPAGGTYVLGPTLG